MTARTREPQGRRGFDLIPLRVVPAHSLRQQWDVDAANRGAGGGKMIGRATHACSPNVVVVVLDSARGAQVALRASGHGPSVERLAARGLRYTSFHTEDPGRLANASALLANVLASNGYRTFTAGRWPVQDTGVAAGGIAGAEASSPDSFSEAVRQVEQREIGTPGTPFFLRLRTSAPADRADGLIGRILTALERAECLEETFIFVVPAQSAESEEIPRASVRTDTMLVHCPARIASSGAFRRQHVHGSDVVATILDVAGIDRGLFEGTSLVATFSCPDEPLVDGTPPAALGARTCAYYPGRISMGPKAAALAKSRSHVIVARTRIPEEGAEGVILAQGGRFFGSTLFVSGNRLWYARTCIGAPDVAIRSDTELQTGPCVVAFEFRNRPAPLFRPGSSASAVGRLYVNGRLSAEAIFPSPFAGVHTIEGDVLCCGYDCGLVGVPVYRPPFRFTGAIRQVVIDTSGDPYDHGAAGESRPYAR